MYACLTSHTEYFCEGHMGHLLESLCLWSATTDLTAQQQRSCLRNVAKFTV